MTVPQKHDDSVGKISKIGHTRVLSFFFFLYLTVSNYTYKDLDLQKMIMHLLLGYDNVIDNGISVALKYNDMHTKTEHHT